MRIDEIIERRRMSYDATSRQDLDDEFDEQFPANLPQFAMISKAAVIAKAEILVKNPRVAPARAIYLATKELYPDLDQDGSLIPEPSNNTDKKKKPNDFTFKSKTPDDKDKGSGRGKYTKYKDGSDRKKSTSEPYAYEPAKSDGSGTISKIAKAINPLSDLDNTDIGTVATSAFRKARSKMKNLDTFRRKDIQKR